VQSCLIASRYRATGGDDVVRVEKWMKCSTQVRHHQRVSWPAACLSEQQPLSASALQAASASSISVDFEILTGLVRTFQVKVVSVDL
jgi:hypothetical protein